jgi:hypothetical protein
MPGSVLHVKGSRGFLFHPLSPPFHLSRKASSGFPPQPRVGAQRINPEGVSFWDIQGVQGVPLQEGPLEGNMTLALNAP